MFVPPAKGSSQEGGPDRSTLFPERWTRVKFVGGGTRTVKDDWIGEGADSDLGADWTGETWFHFEAADRAGGKAHPIFSLGLLPPRETQARPSGRGDSSALLFINDGDYEDSGSQRGPLAAETGRLAAAPSRQVG